VTGIGETSGHADMIEWKNEWTSRCDRIGGGHWSRGPPIGASRWTDALQEV
jgi:hypothetical protein